jgi:hypothetical protein
MRLNLAGFAVDQHPSDRLLLDRSPVSGRSLVACDPVTWYPAPQEKCGEMQMEIGLQQVFVSLRGYGGEAPSGDTFFSLLGVQPHPDATFYPSESAWQAARILLFSVDMRELGDFQEPTEEFAARVAAGFAQAATWLRECQTNSLDHWKRLGKKADVFVGGWLVNEQFDLELPPEFLKECGRLGLPISICTND